MVVMGRWGLFLNYERSHAFKSDEKWSTFLIRKELSMSFYCQRLFFFSSISMSISTWDSLLTGKKEVSVLWDPPESMISGQMELKSENIRGWAEPLQHWIVLGIILCCRGLWYILWTSSDLLKRKQDERVKFALSRFLPPLESKQRMLFFPLVRELKYALDPNFLIIFLKFF